MKRFFKTRDFKTRDRDIAIRLKKHKEEMDKLIATGVSKVQASEVAYAKLFGQATYSGLDGKPMVFSV